MAKQCSRRTFAKVAGCAAVCVPAEDAGAGALERPGGVAAILAGAKFGSAQWEVRCADKARRTVARQ
eukprot:2950595-Pyramimonas_sp.AAC.1